MSLSNGGARRIRTVDILLAKQALYQLSYGPFENLKLQMRDFKFAFGSILLSERCLTLML